MRRHLSEWTVSSPSVKGLTATIPTPLRVLVLGTGTGVGKTVFATSLVRELRTLGVDAVGLKPVETGPDEGSDGSALAAASTAPPSSLYRFAPPISPHLAARRVGVTIELGRIGRWVDELAREATVIEGAGGVFSPFSADAVNLDLVLSVRPSVLVLVCAGRLGVLHEVGATLRATPDAPWARIVVSAVAGLHECSIQAAELASVVVPQSGRSIPVSVFDPTHSALSCLGFT